MTAVAYLDAHYDLNPTLCNSQVVIPWVWTARFAAEVTYHASMASLGAGKGQAPPLVRTHAFRDLHSAWCGLIQTDLDLPRSRRQSLRTRCRAAAANFESIDQEDPNGLMLRYPVPHPDSDAKALPADFVEHCSWPLQCRKLIAEICDITRELLPTSRTQCRHAFGFLRATAAAGVCLGDYDPLDDLEHWAQPLGLPVRDIGQYEYRQVTQWARTPSFVEG